MWQKRNNKKNLKRYFILLFLIYQYIHTAYSQVIDYTSTFKSQSNKLLRLHFDNDYFTKTDKYYTEGITLEFLHPSLKESPINFFIKN